MPGRGSWLDVTYPGLFPVSNQTCEFFNCECTLDDVLNNACTTEEFLACFIEGEVRNGLCSERTKQLLSTDQLNCIHPLYTQRLSIYNTVWHLVRSLCDVKTSIDFVPAPIVREGVNNKIRKSKINHRLTPIESIDEQGGVTLARVPPLQHTKHRYPWICSLRSVSQESSHICGVTLLSRPPGPTVLVTSAHCSYICKSEEGRIVPNCCCPNVGPGLCTDTEDCGTTTAQITGAEAEVKCGEWENSQFVANDYFNHTS